MGGSSLRIPLFLIACPTLLANSSNAIQLFNKRLPEICDFLRRVFAAQSTHALLCLVHLQMAIKFSIARFPRDKDELTETATLVDHMMVEVLRCNAFDSQDNVLKLLLPSVSIQNDHVHSYGNSMHSNSDRTGKGSNTSTNTGSGSGTGTGTGASKSMLSALVKLPSVRGATNKASSDSDRNLKYLTAAYALQQDQLLGLCLKHELKGIFGCSQV